MSLTPVRQLWLGSPRPCCVNWAGLVMTLGRSELGCLPVGSCACAFCPGCCAVVRCPPGRIWQCCRTSVISTKKLEEYETLFMPGGDDSRKLVLEYQARLEEGRAASGRQQEDKDIQMKGIISR